jgi:hypothetical protein
METLTFRMSRKKAFLLHTAAIAFIAVGLFVLVFSRVFAARLVIPILFGLMAAFLML